MGWSNENVMEFLEYYEKESIIWNPLHRDNKNRNNVYDAWKRIEKKMGRKYSVTELKKKKESLMASFRAYNNKVKDCMKSGASEDEVYKPNWFAYAKMSSFLGNKDQAKQTINSEDLASQLSQDKSENDEGSDENFPTNNMDEHIKNEVSEEVPSTLKSSFKPPLQHKKKLPDEAVQKRDFCDKYGEIVADRLRQLDERARDIAINHIDNILFQIKMNQNIPNNPNLPIFTCAYPQHSQSSSSQISNTSHQSPATTLSQPSSPYQSSAKFEESILGLQSNEPVFGTLNQC